MLSKILNSFVNDKYQIRYNLENLYLIEGSFKFYTVDDSIEIRNILVIFNKFIDIEVIKLNKKEDLDKILSGIDITTIKEPTGYAHHYYDWNIAHGLCDTLYPMFLNYLHFFDNKNFNKNFNIFLKLKFVNGWKFVKNSNMNTPYTASRNNLLNIFKVFGGAELLLDTSDHHGKFENYKFENIFLGNACGGLQGSIMHINTCLLGKDKLTLEKFRDRMYNKYDIKYNEYSNEDILIIDNDRFSQGDRNIMYSLKDYFLKNNYNCKFLHWGNITDFREQLKIMSKVKFHISGAGTSFYNFIFLRNSSINLLLGTTKLWSYSPTPGLMDMSICILSNYIYTYYYDITKFKGLVLDKILKIIEEILNYSYKIHMLPDVVKIWNELCLQDKDNMNNFKLRLAGYAEPSLFEKRAIELIIYNFYKYPINYSLLNKIKYYYTNEKNIFQIYHDKKLIPDFVSKNIKELNPNYNYRFLDFEEGKDIIRKEIFDKEFKHKLLHAIDTMPRYCHKSDILRYTLLYIFGGCYLDVDLKMFVGFEKYSNIDFMFAKGETDIGNGLLVARKRSPILLDLLVRAINNKKLYDSNPDYRGENIYYLFNYFKNKCLKNNIQFDSSKLLEINNEKVYFLKGEYKNIQNYGINCFLDKNEVIMTPNDPLYKFERQTSSFI